MRVGVVQHGHHGVALAALPLHITGHRGHIAQGTGFEPRVADHGRLRAAVFEAGGGAVHPGDGQRVDKVPGVRAGVRGLQQGREGLRGAALGARQARAVVQHRLVDSGKALTPPLRQAQARGLQTPGCAQLARQRQVQLLRHHVVRELVDVLDDLGQGQGRRFQQQLGRGRARAVTHLSRELSACLLPQGLHDAWRIGFGLRVGHGPFAFAAAGGVATRKAHLLGLAEVGLQLAPPVAARGLGQWQLRGRGEPGQGRLKAHLHLAAGGIGREGVDHGLEVEQQAIRPHVVRAQGLVVKRLAALAHIEHAAVEHDVPAHLAHTSCAHLGQQLLQALDHQLGVAAAAHDQVALQHAIAHRAVGVDPVAPDVLGPEQAQARIGGEQLHDRGRVDAGLRVVRQVPWQGPIGRRSIGQGGDAHAQGRRGDLGLVQRVHDMPGQRSVTRRGLTGPVVAAWGIALGLGRPGHRTAQGQHRASGVDECG